MGFHFNKSPPSTNGISAMAEKHTAFATPDSLASDEDLIALVSRGDIEAFECLVQRHQKSALRAARRFLGDSSEAEDLAQEAFLQTFHQAHRYRAERATFKTWFFTILLNLCRNAIKKRRLVYSDNPFSNDAADRDTPSTLLARRERPINVRLLFCVITKTSVTPKPPKVLAFPLKRLSRCSSAPSARCATNWPG
jgi:RNA polymerase sigma factor (sigma-70 family)